MRSSSGEAWQNITDYHRILPNIIKNYQISQNIIEYTEYHRSAAAALLEDCWMFTLLEPQGTEVQLSSGDA